jgi:hypothetical protein
VAELVEQVVALASEDAYGRRIILRRKGLGGGKTVWEIESEPVSQQDEGERMSGLTDRNLAELASVLEVVRGHG